MLLNNNMLFELYSRREWL